MSLKSNMYGIAMHAPKTTCKFHVMLPGCEWSAIRVSECSLPMVRHNTSDVKYLGRRVTIPNDRDMGGTWSCTYDEDMTMSGLFTISRLDHMVKTNETAKRRILVFVTDEFTGEIPQNCVVLNDAFVKEVSDTQLDWGDAQVIRHKITFGYSYISRWY